MPRADDVFVSSDGLSSTEEMDLCRDRRHPSPHPLPNLLSLKKAQRMAEFLGILSDPNRLRILALLANGERCVGDIAQLLGMNESAVSHQLRLLRANRLVDYRKQGRHVFYCLEDDHVLSFYRAIAEHLDETPTDE